MTQKRSDQPNNELCQFPFSDGRRCLMLRHPKHPQLCPFHAQAELQILESRQLGTEISSTLTGHFITSADVVHMLGKVFTAFAQDRIPQKKAATLAYLGQVMLHSMPQVASETEIAYSFKTWCKFLERSGCHQDSRPVPAATNTRADTAISPSAADAPPAPGSNANAAPSPEPASALNKNPRQANSSTPVGARHAVPVPAPRPASTVSPPRPVTPSESALPQKPPLTPVESAHPKQTT